MITPCNGTVRRARWVGLTGAALATLVALTACGGDDAETTEATSIPTTASAAETTADTEAPPTSTTAPDDEASDADAAPGEDASDSSYPVTVEHDAGTTTIDAAPERILAVTDQGELAALLALGIRPVAYGQRSPMELAYLAEAGAYDPAIEVFPSTADINFEQLASFQPDLIVGQTGFVTPDNLALFEGIAPTIAIDSIGWREGLLDVGAATDNDEAAERKVAELEALLDGFAERVPFAEGRTVDIIVGARNTIFQYTDFNVLNDILVSAGVEPLPAPNDPSLPNGNEISEENLGLIDAEALVVLDFTGALLPELEANPLWTSLPAVADDNVTVWGGAEAAATNFTNALTVPVILDLLEAMLTDAFAG